MGVLVSKGVSALGPQMHCLPSWWVSGKKRLGGKAVAEKMVLPWESWGNTDSRSRSNRPRKGEKNGKSCPRSLNGFVWKPHDLGVRGALGLGAWLFPRLV